MPACPSPTAPCGKAIGEAIERQPGCRQQFTTDWRERDTSRFAEEQGVADLVFQAADLLAQRWLRDTEAGGRVSEVEFLGEHDEGVQLRKGKFGALHTLRDAR